MVYCKVVYSRATYVSPTYKLCRLSTALGMESRERIHFVTQHSVRADQLHPLPSRPASYNVRVEELNLTVSDSTVYKHIQKRIDAGIGKEIALDNDQRRQG